MREESELAGEQQRGVLEAEGVAWVKSRKGKRKCFRAKKSRAQSCRVGRDRSLRA